MSAAQAALAGRALAEAQMDSTCQVFTPGEPVTDPSTGEVTRPQTVVWSGPCRIRPAAYVARSVEAGGAELFSFDYLVSIPWDVVDVVEHMRLTVTFCPDLAMAGMTLEIQNVARGSTVTARRLACTVVV